jgi:predicted MFS family arabinose efflux permease
MSLFTSATRVHAPAARPPSDRLLTASFVRLGVADLGYFLASGVAVYTLPLYVTGPVGSDAGGAGLAFGAFALSAVVLRPLAGRWSDAHGRRPRPAAGAMVAAAALFLTPLAHGLAAVVALRLLLGLGEALFFVASLAALADLAPPGRTGEAVSYNSLGLYLGLGLGAPLGEVLVRSVGFAGAWTAAGLLAAGAAGMAGTLGETRPPRRGDEPAPALLHRPAVPVALGFLASVVAMGGFLGFAALHAGAVGLTSASLPLLTYGLVVVVVRVALARVQDRLPPLQVGATALVLMSVGLLVMVGWAAPAGVVVGAAVVGVGVALSTPAFFAAIFATADPATRGAAAGTASLSLDLGIGAGPVVLGQVAQVAGLPAVFVVAAGVAALGSAWTLSLLRTGRRAAVDERA